MNYQGALGGDGDFAAFYGGQAGLVALDVTADDGIGALGNLDGAGALVGVKCYIDVIPLLAGHVLAIDMEGHEAIFGGQEVQVAAHHVGTTHVEGGMCLAHGDEVLVVLHHLGIALHVVPIEMVDAVGALVAVVDALLVAQHLLTAEHERHTL